MARPASRSRRTRWWRHLECLPPRRGTWRPVWISASSPPALRGRGGMEGQGYSQVKPPLQPGSSSLIPRRLRLPVIPMASLLIAVVEQRPHVSGVERFRQLHGEVLADIGEVIADAVLQRGEVYAHDVVIAAGSD